MQNETAKDNPNPFLTVLSNFVYDVYTAVHNWDKPKLFDVLHKQIPKISAIEDHITNKEVFKLIPNLHKKTEDLAARFKETAHGGSLRLPSALQDAGDLLLKMAMVHLHLYDDAQMKKLKNLTLTLAHTNGTETKNAAPAAAAA